MQKAVKSLKQQTQALAKLFAKLPKRIKYSFAVVTSFTATHFLASTVKLKISEI